MIRAYGSQIVWGDGGRIKIRPYNMIRAYGSQWRHLKKCQLSLNLFETCRYFPMKKIALPGDTPIKEIPPLELISSRRGCILYGISCQISLYIAFTQVIICY